ncbi:MAG TPA: Co2+/Mg2+ efflux protein ApaG [Rhizomicrobium sp.]|jgi:ApaG protein|nr:Co2+/Mg2+ efflux protein ApaG [Rhizomicrobium sp.]
MYERMTRGIKVAVKPAFLDDQSDPDGGQYLWSYTVMIENRGAEPVQLLSRYWHITDALGRVKEVSGPGVVGAQPVIPPGEKFQYTSGCPLPTSSGCMVGHYNMKTASGEAFEAEIPAFLLESPHERRQIH